MDDIFHTRNPRTNKIAATFSRSAPTEIDAASKIACVAQQNTWRLTPPAQRAKALAAITEAIRRHSAELARAEAVDTGKPLRVATQEVNGAISLWEYAAHLAATKTDRLFASGIDGGHAYTISEPIGVVGMIVPWNYPLITTSERLPFALAAGCGVILKPSETAAGCLPALTGLIASQPEFPTGLVQTVFGDGQVGKSLCEHPLVDMISFVGSTRVGRIVEATAVAHGKRVSAEMGGNNFVLVFSDADLKRAAHATIAGAFRNAGQACIAGTHVLVEPAIVRTFLNHLTEELQQHYPADEPGATQPLITPEHAKRVESLINAGLDEGLTVLAGSNSNRRGNWIGPVVFENVPPQSALFREEIFGPVLTVTTLPATQFVDLANSTGYGLAAYIWTSSTTTSHSMVANIRAGRIWINANPDHWLPELSAGGFGASGTGRELGPQALDNYALPKSVLCG